MRRIRDLQHGFGALVILFALAFGAWPSMAQQITTSDATTDPATPFAFNGNGYDFVLFVCRARNVEVAIDPEVLADLAKLKLDIPTPSTATGWGLIRDHLGPHGFVIQQVPVSTTRKIAFLTSPAGWAHLNAMDALRRKDYKAAYQHLKSVENDKSEFGKHCLNLRKAFDEIVSRNAQMANMELTVNRCLENFRRALSDLETARMAHSSRLGGGQSHVIAFAENRYNQAVAEAQKAWEAMDALFEKMKTSNEQIGEVFGRSHGLGYISEAAFLFDNLYTSFIRFRTLLGAMQREKLVKADVDLSKVPDQVTELREQLNARTVSAQNEVRVAATALDAGDLASAREGLNRAYWLDAALPGARFGNGSVSTRVSLTALQQLFETISLDEQQRRMAALETELRSREKISQLRCLHSIKTGQPVEGQFSAAVKQGSLSGLSVSNGKGCLLPVSVRIENIPSQKRPAQKKADGYWDSVMLKEIYDRDWPVAFGDYGAKDPFMMIAAVEAYKWLRSVDGMFKDRMGLRVDFQELFAGKAGDSAGVTIATAAYSLVRKVPLREDIAMTGSIRGDGVVKAVGAIPHKIAGAVDARKIELVIVPRENEPDLLTLPVDVFSRMTIVAADDVRTYLKYATETDAANPSEEQHIAREVVNKLHEIQILLAVGRADQAQEKLVQLAGAPAELYSVHRLLQLMEARYSSEGKIEQAAELRRQLEAARTRSLLNPKASDFKIQIKDVVPGSHTDPPVRAPGSK